ncbi:Rha family regulatory protein [Vibrio phage 1.042.O._10N.286.45.B8]|nr:Rha family regulatory protein [Vibrio phage 1.042.O._10N.286.45.B8]
MLSIIQENQPLTMSSREIAELTGKEHKNVTRTIESLMSGGILTAQVEPLSYEHRGNWYRFYELNKRDCLVVVARLSPEFTAAIVDRWQELENKNKPQLPDFTNPIEAARAWADSQEKLLLVEKTKAQINDKRTATIMGRLGNAAKTIKKLEDKLQDVGTYQSVTASKIPARVDTEMKNNVQSWRLLKRLSSDMQLPPKKVKCERYGEVLAYHINVIELFKSKYL